MNAVAEGLQQFGPFQQKPIENDHFAVFGVFLWGFSESYSTVAKDQRRNLKSI
jgi:hypothetical protein